MNKAELAKICKENRQPEWETVTEVGHDRKIASLKKAYNEK